jgi:outer membrane protein OmpA-like peptidoglycan-associated protein
VALRGRSQETDEESYFVSMADMMVGLVFIFIVLLLYFALQFRQSNARLTDATQTRTVLLEQLDRQLLDRGLAVSIDTRSGVLRLPEDVLFDRGQAELNPRGHAAAAILSDVLTRTLSCYSYPRPRTGCVRDAHGLDAVFVEGHTDRDALAGRGAVRDNLDLSVARATNTYRALLAVAPRLATMRNGPAQGGQPILSVAGYGADRPIDPGDSASAKARNRRIDLRFLMTGPELRS